jgi:ABC-type uncharacterized transport system ATPase component
VPGGALSIDDDDVVVVLGHDGGGKGTGETEHAVGAGGELVLDGAFGVIAVPDAQGVVQDLEQVDQQPAWLRML